MGYHIFMARKVQLTTLKNDAYSSMMTQWIAQENIANQEIQLMTERNDSLVQYGEEYKTARDSAYEQYNNFVKGQQEAAESGIETEEQQEFTIEGKSLRDYLDDLSDDYTEKKEQLNNDYSVNYEVLSDEESAIEKTIQTLETRISEYTEEMSKVEQQEATEIKTCIPNYNGAGGGQ